MMSAKQKQLGSLGLLVLLFSQSVLAGGWNTNKDGVVLDGYDVVAYRTADRATPGKSEYSVHFDGGLFYFSSKANKEVFVNNPERYVPEYHGYCAFAMGAKNAKVPANADTFKLYNGKLLVFFNDEYEGQKVNTKILWNQNEKNLYGKAESNWMHMKP